MSIVTKHEFHWVAAPKLDSGRKSNFFYAFTPQKIVKYSSDGRARHRNRSGVVDSVGREPWMFARVESDKIVPNFSPEKHIDIWYYNCRKNAILAWNCPLFWAGSLVVRKSRAVDIGVTEFPTKTAETNKKNGAWDFFFKVGVRVPFSILWGISIFLAAEKLTFLGVHNFKTG